MQRQIEFSDGSQLRGFTNTKVFKALAEPAKKIYHDMAKDAQQVHRFANKATLLQYLRTPDASLVTRQRIKRARDADSVREENERIKKAKGKALKASDLISAPYTESMLSLYQAHTEPHVNNVAHFVHLWSAKLAEELAARTDLTPAERTQRYADLMELVDRARAAAEELDDAAAVDVESSDVPVVSTSDLNSALTQAQELTRRPMSNFVRPGEEPRAYPRLVLPVFGELRRGMGTSVRITVERSSVYPEGSSASGTTTDLPWQTGHLAHRKWGEAGRDESLYVRGHLLNDHVGGMARAANLVPLTGISTTSTPNANKWHEAGIEGQAKASIKEMFTARDAPKDPFASDLQDENAIHLVSYAVWVSGWGQSRQNTSALVNAHKEVADFATKHNLLGATVTDLFEAVKSSLYPQLWPQIYPAIQAVAKTAPPANEVVRDLLPLMRSNAELWLYEDANVPSELTAMLTVAGLNGGHREQTIKIASPVPDHPARMRYV